LDELATSIFKVLKGLPEVESKSLSETLTHTCSQHGILSHKTDSYQYWCKNHDCVNVTRAQGAAKSETCTDNERSWYSHFQVQWNL